MRFIVLIVLVLAIAITQGSAFAGPAPAEFEAASQQDSWWISQGEISTNFIAMYKALGGGWESQVGQELVPEYIRQKMKKQADWWSFTGKYDLRQSSVKFQPGASLLKIEPGSLA